MILRASAPGALLVGLFLVSLAGCAAAPLVQPAPPDVLRTVLAVPVAGPVYAGNAFHLSGSAWATCRHIVPADAGAYHLAGSGYELGPLRTGMATGIAGDWCVLQGETVAGTAVAVDLERRLEPGTIVWIVGWRATERAPGFELAMLAARLADIAAESVPCHLEGLPQIDNPGLSGAPVVLVEGARATIVGIYCGFVEQRTTLLGLTISRDQRSVSLRPPELAAAVAPRR